MRIQDIINAANDIINYAHGLNFDTFSENQTIVKVILYDYIIIGEASRHIPRDIQQRYPEIPWRLMADMRNIITHEYFQVKLKLIWQGIHRDLPLLIDQLQHLLEKESSL
jgi:uncharacterized protein with HEPN domain